MVLQPKSRRTAGEASLGVENNDGSEHAEFKCLKSTNRDFELAFFGGGEVKILSIYLLT